MSEKEIKLLVSKEKLSILKHVELGFYEDCVKQKRVNFSKAVRTPKKEKLKLVHMTVWGPTFVSSIGGSHYYVTFIDNFMERYIVYFLKNKFDMFVIVKMWEVEVENHMSLKIKCP